MLEEGRKQKDMLTAETSIIELRGMSVVFKELGFASAMDEWSPPKDVWKQFTYLAGSIDRLCDQLSEALWPNCGPDGQP